MKPKVTAANIAAKFREKGLTPTYGIFNLTILDGKFVQRYDSNQCCPIAAWVLGEPVQPGLDPRQTLSEVGMACVQFTRDTGIDGQMFWREFDAACQSAGGSDGFGAEVAELLRQDLVH